MTTRIALFSDIHANLPALEVVLADINRRSGDEPFDSVYCLGDLGGYASQPNEVQEYVMATGYTTISGNYDENVGNNGDDCGCHYVKPFDIEMSNISFNWTKAHTSNTNKEWLRSLVHEIRLDVEGVAGVAGGAARSYLRHSGCTQHRPACRQPGRGIR